MAAIPVGTRGEYTLLVTPEVAIDFLGASGARVLSTPHMIAYMEKTCRTTVLPLLEPGHDTVGTHVDVRHAAAAPIGSAVRFTAEVIDVDGRRIRFRVEARDGEEVVGDGTHERTIINVERFAAKLSGKKKEET
jgi:predicted thioesterase